VEAKPPTEEPDFGNFAAELTKPKTASATSSPDVPDGAQGEMAANIVQGRIPVQVKTDASKVSKESK
jgi:hypothetical protein